MLTLLLLGDFMKATIIICLLLSLPQLGWAARYTHPNQDFTFQYDESLWEIVPLESQTKQGARAMPKGTVVVVQKQKAHDSYHSRVSLVEVARQASNIEDFHNSSVKFLESQHFVIHSDGKKKLSGLAKPAFETIASQRESGLMARQMVFSYKGKMLLLTASTRIDDFKKSQKEIDQIVDSFEFSPEAKVSKPQ